jgi:cob(I)alamin adenosyltransferase
MVRLSKIYTKVGDGGMTMLGDGAGVSKASPRVCAYGEVDEANALIGVVLAGLGPQQHQPGPLAEIESELLRVQQDLFDLGADLCVPVEPHETPGSRLRITDGQAQRLEQAIDRFNENLPALGSFVLPGGTLLAAHLHAARTVTRRAERAVAALLLAEPERTRPGALVYLNRLSDLLFVMARIANTPACGGEGDTLWIPGANRSDPNTPPAQP